MNEEPAVSDVKIKKAQKPAKKPGNGKKKFGIFVFILGTLILTAGVVFLVLDLLKKPVVRDVDYLVNVGVWQMQDHSEVVWDFAEIGKGTLTTNFHINDYTFLWRIDGDTLKIETDWLYALDDEYTYELDQNERTLTLTNGENTYNLTPPTP